MLERLLLSVVAVGVLSTSMAVAADLNGKWKAEFTTPDGTARFNTFNFKADGANLTGTVAGAQDETPIQNGKISGDEISFTAERPFGSFSYKGKVSGAEIKFKVTFGDQSFDITAKRLPS
jgi:hypothetical protein